MCRLLIEAGADCRVLDDQGRDAAALAAAHGHEETSQTIRTLTSSGLGHDELPPDDGRGRFEPDRAVDRPQVAPASNGTRSEDPAISFTGEARSKASALVRATVVPDDPGCGGPDFRQRPCSSEAEGLLSAVEPASLADGEFPVFAERLDWEAEDDACLLPGGSLVEAAARLIQRAHSVHEPTTSDADWSDVEVVLPPVPHRWLASFQGAALLRATRNLIEQGLREGWIPEERLDALTSLTLSGEPDVAVGHRVRVVLADLGVRVEECAFLPWLPPTPETEDEESHAPLVDDALAFLEDLSEDYVDVAFLLRRDAMRFRPPSASDERLMFIRRDAATDALLGLLGREPRALSRLEEWATSLETGDLSPSDLLADTSLEVPEPETLELHDLDEREIEGGVIGDQANAAKAEISTQHLATKLRSFGTATGSLRTAGLSGRRIVELAEHALDRSSGRVDAGRRSEVLGSVRLALADHVASRRRIVEANQRLVLSQAERYARHLPLADLHQEGMIGLMRAIERFDPNRGAKFATYAIWWIRQSMHRAIQEQNRTIRIPVHVLDRHARVRRALASIGASGSSEPDLADIAVAADETSTAVARLLALPEASVSLDDLDASGAAEALRSDAPSPLRNVLQADLRRCLEHGLQRLPGRSGDILRLRFGLHDGEPRTLEELGQLYGVTRERIRQIESKALGQLGRLLPSRHFDAMRP